MTSTAMRAATLVAATITMGFAADSFYLFAHTIMPGLRRADDRTFVTAFQHIDRAIENPWFMLGAFGGALISTIVAVVAHRGTPAMPWVVAALVLYGVAVVITMAVNVPLNNAIRAAGEPGRVEVAQVRASFHETRWVIANIIRAGLTIPAFGCLAWALVLYGRSTG
jgi:uncharacterized membrane protein